MPPYSVVVPCYNVASLVDQAVMSALTQREPPLEVICVDDGSTDGTLAVLRALAAAHGRVRVLAQANGGAPSARNAGLRAARGAWVQFLDADDRLLPGKVARQLALVAAGPEVALVASAYEVERADGRRDRIEVGCEDPLRALVLDRHGITSANLFRRAAVEAAGGWDEARPCCQEYELMFRMLARGARVAWDDEPHTVVLDREGSVGKHPESFRINMTFRRDVLGAYSRRPRRSAEGAQQMHDFLFRWIRSHYQTDPAGALDAYRLVLPASFVPRPGGNTTHAYALAFRALGFERAERARGLVGGVRRRLAGAAQGAGRLGREGQGGRLDETALRPALTGHLAATA